MKNRRINSLNWTILKVAIIPMILFMLISSTVGSYYITRSINKQVKDSMIDINNTILVSLNENYPGSYSYTEEADGIHFFKGEHQFNDDFYYIDQIKAVTNCDITLCYMNYAVITTIQDASGKRIIGAGENARVYEDVIVSKKAKLYENVKLGNKLYFAYYSPLMDETGEIVGMLCVAMSAEDIKALVNKAILPILAIELVTFVIICLFVLRFSKNLVSTIKKLQNYMKLIADGEFRSQMDNDVIKREDEIGDMARSSVNMAAALRSKVEEDQLTKLYNRRSADKFVKKTIRDYIEKGVKFSLVIGDIDFFKKVNDTYGHEAGDDVLQAVSFELKKYLQANHGYAIRWGGEEFILVYSDILMDETKNHMEALLNNIRALDIVNNDNHIKVTMTFGIVDCTNIDLTDVPADDDLSLKDRYLKNKMDEYISMADAKLYYGKEHGRNRIVTVLENTNDTTV